MNAEQRITNKRTKLTSTKTGHVNNVMYVRYAETGRINWSRNIALYHDPENSEQWSQLGGSTSIGYILKSIKVDFKFVSLPRSLYHLTSTNMHYLAHDVPGPDMRISQTSK